MTDILKFILSFLGGGGFVVVVVVWALHNLDKVEKLAAWFFGTFSWVSQRLEYAHVASKIQSSVNGFGETLSKEAPEVLPHAMKIEWVKNADGVGASLRNGEVVVALDYSPNHDRNLVVSTLAYLGKGLLPTARPYLDRNLIKATDFTVAKSIFVSSGQGLATQYFFEQYLKPEIDGNNRLKSDCQTLDLLIDRGIFSRIFLRQLRMFGDKVYPATPDNLTSKESRDFVEFLNRVASKERGVAVPGGLTFTGPKIRISLMLVALSATLEREGLQPFRRRIQLCRNMRIEYLYILGVGNLNVGLAEHIAREQQSEGTLLVLDSQKFRRSLEGRNYTSICILCRLKITAPSNLYSEIDTVVNVVEEYVGEIGDGKAEIVYITRSPGITSKIVVRSLAQGINAADLCKDPVKLTAMQFALGGEYLDFIEWSDDPKSLVISSLTPLRPEFIVESQIDASQKKAVIKVRNQRAKALAEGIGGVNLQLATELTGYNIIIEVAKPEL